ncbi:MAG: hypothetical protein K2J79_05360 [Ruminiclostridium sp.]|nr:hypothetical protein [Ruminiclostridium sp.]
MKLKKILAAAAASVMAIGTLAVSASAGFYVPEGELAPGLQIGGNWLIQLYNTGNPDENKPAVDYGLDVTKVASMTAYVEYVPANDSVSLEDYDASIDGGLGGAMIWSANGGEYGTSDADELYKKYNWPGTFNQWWGLPEKDDTYEGRPEANGGNNTNTGTADWDANLVLKYIRRFGYELTMEIPDDYRWIPGATCHQVGVQTWSGNEYFSLKVTAYTVKDDDGNVLLAFDELGNKIDEAKLKEIVDEFSKPVVDEEGGDAPSSDTPADTNDGNAENTAATEAAPSDTNAANTTASTTAAPASSSNGGNTGLIIGIIAGVVVVIVVVVIVVIKKKK